MAKPLGKPEETSAGESYTRYNGVNCPIAPREPSRLVHRVRKNAMGERIRMRVAYKGVNRAVYWRKLVSGHDGFHTDRRSFQSKPKSFHYHVKANAETLKKWNIGLRFDPHGSFYWQGAFYQAQDKRCKQWLKRNSVKLSVSTCLE